MDVKVITTLATAEQVIADLQEQLRDANNRADSASRAASEATALAERRWYELRDSYVCAALPLCGAGADTDAIATRAFDIANALLRRRRTGVPPYEGAS